jgi:hypothetical protein
LIKVFLVAIMMHGGVHAHDVSPLGLAGCEALAERVRKDLASVGYGRGSTAVSCHVIDVHPEH